MATTQRSTENITDSTVRRSGSCCSRAPTASLFVLSCRYFSHLALPSLQSIVSNQTESLYPEVELHPDVWKAQAVRARGSCCCCCRRRRLWPYTPPASDGSSSGKWKIAKGTAARFGMTTHTTWQKQRWSLACRVLHPGCTKVPVSPASQMFRWDIQNTHNLPAVTYEPRDSSHARLCDQLELGTSHDGTWLQQRRALSVHMQRILSYQQKRSNQWGIFVKSDQ